MEYVAIIMSLGMDERREIMARFSGKFQETITTEKKKILDGFLFVCFNFVCLFYFP